MLPIYSMVKLTYGEMLNMQGLLQPSTGKVGCHCLTATYHSTKDDINRMSTIYSQFGSGTNASHAW